MESICSWTDRTSPTVVAFARMVRYCWRLACRAVTRDCRSTYCPVTSVALVVRSDVRPSAWARASTVAKLFTGTWSVTLPEGVAPDCVCELATKPPSETASAVNCVTVRLSLPRPTVRVREPVCSILADWPTAPFGRLNVFGGVAALAGADPVACAAPEGAASLAFAVAPLEENAGVVVVVVLGAAAGTLTEVWGGAAVMVGRAGL